MRELDEKQDRVVKLFDFVNDISFNKDYLLSPDTQGVYNSFIINKAFSQHVDTIMMANEMNKRPDISKEFHHDFLFYGLNSKKRYGKWAKKEEVNEEVIQFLKDNYALGNERALEYFNMMPDEDIANIEKMLKTKNGRT